MRVLRVVRCGSSSCGRVFRTLSPTRRYCSRQCGNAESARQTARVAREAEPAAIEKALADAAERRRAERAAGVPSALDPWAQRPGANPFDSDLPEPRKADVWRA